MKIQLQQMAVLLNIQVFREEGRTLLNMILIFSDLHKKVSFRSGLLAHLEKYCKAVVKAMVDQVPVWSFLDMPSRVKVQGVALGGQQVAPSLCLQYS